MAVNTFKSPEPELIRSGSEKAGPILLPWLDGSFSLAEFFRDGIPAPYLPKIAFSFFLCLHYIGISHQSSRTIQKLNKAKTLLEDLRVNYTTQKSDLMYSSKQSKISVLVAPYGLLESETPPQKINSKED